jgi:hypothetical protein
MVQRFLAALCTFAAGVLLTNALWAAGRPDHQIDVVSFTVTGVLVVTVGMWLVVDDSF